MDRAIADGAEDRTTDTVHRLTGRPPHGFRTVAAREAARVPREPLVADSVPAPVGRARFGLSRIQPCCQGRVGQASHEKRRTADRFDLVGEL
ncbi:hypothetical protein [Streptomyces griseoloalbus]|uniref:Uncharacterized protein n=1 Tax=Streptomyces griseoloalbus TaxID=67303 RepID=A0A7W8F6J3_9ACTN|nr:hypothetical protein [Streptomyces albaduncus]